MKELINALTGVSMLVADDRVDEYTAAGHKLAAIPTTEKPEETPKKAAPKRTTKKKK